MIIVIMGVAGSGKTVVASTLARELGWEFLEGDSFHSNANIEKMSRGVPLTDEDREPWLRALHRRLETADREGENVVLACSALRRRFREELGRGLRDLSFVYLRIDRSVAETRLRLRVGHFMPATLVDTQFDALEEPEDAIVIDGTPSVETVVAEIRRGLADR